MADKKLSIAEILAAARKKDGVGGDQAGKDDQPAAAETEQKAAKAPSPKPGEKLSVADMLAAARSSAKGSSAKGEKPEAPKSAAAKKPAAKAKPAEKKKAAASSSSGPKDTASILAAARNAAKPGPMSKSEAASKKSDDSQPSKPKSVVPPMPVKPKSVKELAASRKKAAPAERRSFLATMLGTALGIGFTSVAATTGLMAAGFARFMFPNILNEPPSSFPVGFPGDFAANQVETKYKAQFGVWIVNTNYDGQQVIYALKSVCTHLGCTPNWLEAEQKYKCPCHGSGFYKDGINFEGPAPRPLERYAISVASDGQLVVDKSKKFQEELGQWQSPDSFVLV